MGYAFLHHESIGDTSYDIKKFRLPSHHHGEIYNIGTSEWLTPNTQVHACGNTGTAWENCTQGDHIHSPFPALRKMDLEVGQLAQSLCLAHMVSTCCTWDMYIPYTARCWPFWITLALADVNSDQISVEVLYTIPIWYEIFNIGSYLPIYPVWARTRFNRGWYQVWNAQNGM